MPNVYLSIQAEKDIQDIINQFKIKFGTPISRSEAINHMFSCSEDFRKRWSEPEETPSKK